MRGEPKGDSVEPYRSNYTNTRYLPKARMTTPNLGTLCWSTLNRMLPKVGPSQLWHGKRFKGHVYIMKLHALGPPRTYYLGTLKGSLRAYYLGTWGAKDGAFGRVDPKVLLLT